MEIALWDHQTLGINLLRQSIQQKHKRPLLKGPTGTGKTRLAAAIIRSAVKKGGKCIFLAPAVSLIEQTAKAFRELGLRDVACIQSDNYRYEPAKPVQVASVHTISARGLRVAEEINPTIIIVDEAHVNNKFLFDWMQKWSNILFIGLSATPWTKGLGKQYDDLVSPITMKEAMEKKILCDYKCYAPDVPNMEGIAIKGDDYDSDQTSTLMGKKEIMSNVVRTYKKLWGKGKSLVFCVDVNHSKKQKEEFELAGIPCHHIDAHTPIEEREFYFEQLMEGVIDVICNVGTLTTGIDLDIRYLALARPTKSEILFQQIVGRVLRSAEGKEFATIADHSGTFITLGRPEDIDYTDLHDGTRAETLERKKEAEERDKPCKCPQCQAIKDQPTCKNCGHTPEVRTDVIVHEGELVELRQAKDQQQEYANMLEHYRKEKGYQKGWVMHSMAKKFKDKLQPVKPPHPIPPNEEVKKYIKYLNIRNAHSKKVFRPNI